MQSACRATASWGSWPGLPRWRVMALRGPVAARAARTDRGHRGDRHRGCVGGGTGGDTGVTWVAILVATTALPRVSAHYLHYGAFVAPAAAVRDWRLGPRPACSSGRGDGLPVHHRRGGPRRGRRRGADHRSDASPPVAGRRPGWRLRRSRECPRFAGLVHRGRRFDLARPREPPTASWRRRPTHRRPLRRPECRRAEFGDRFASSDELLQGPAAQKLLRGYLEACPFALIGLPLDTWSPDDQGVPRGAVPDRRLTGQPMAARSCGVVADLGSLRPPRPRP